MPKFAGQPAFPPAEWAAPASPQPAPPPPRDADSVLNDIASQEAQLDAQIRQLQAAKAELVRRRAHILGNEAKAGNRETASRVAAESLPMPVKREPAVTVARVKEK